jgi:hypothetical protein
MLGEPRRQIVPRPPRREVGQAPNRGDRPDRLAASAAEWAASVKTTAAGSSAALYAALRLVRNPALKSRFQQEPLPAGMARLIRLASFTQGSDYPETSLDGADPVFLRAAAIYYLECVAWVEGGSHFRALGLRSGASKGHIAEAAWTLMEWLHPFVGTSEHEAAFADRVLDAWTELKTGRSGGRRLANGFSLPASIRLEAIDW